MPYIVIDCTFAMHECNDIYRQEDEDRAPFFFFSFRRAYKEYPAKLPEVNDPDGEGETGRKATGEKSVSIPRTNLHLLRTIMHALGVFRLEPGSRLQSGKDGLLYLCMNVDSRYRGYRMTNIYILHYPFCFLSMRAKLSKLLDDNESSSSQHT